MVGTFGTDLPAVGCSINIDNLISAVKAQSGDDNEKYLTFALAKGRLAEKAMGLLEKMGITCDEMKEDSRKLIFTNEKLKVKFFLAKATDVPTYVESGAADIGFVGKDTLLEENRNLYEVYDLGFGKCRFAVAGFMHDWEKYKHSNDLRVATKYPNVAKEHFYHKKHQTIEIVKLNGSVELAPIVGLAHVIVDIVETGSTLKANGLEVLEDVCPISARMVVNRVSMKLEHKRIAQIIQGLRELTKQ
ncbi:MAG: ATP phosphoribosyltransferase [Firmicutes bacterium]|nr:ATP phosphoribosyltransferase [Bacillota bacterium]